MTEEIINADGSRNWEANILLDNIKRLEQENKENIYYLACMTEQRNKLKSALEEINITVKQLLQGVSSNCINNTPYLIALSLIGNKINEVLK